MKVVHLVGAVLILAGGILIARGIQYSSRHDVVDLGGLRVSVNESRPIPPWVGGIVALVGLGLVFSGGRPR